MSTLSPVLAFKPDDALGLWFPSVKSAADYMGVTPAPIRAACNSPRHHRMKRRRMSAGWCWRYVEV